MRASPRDLAVSHNVADVLTNFCLSLTGSVAQGKYLKKIIHLYVNAIEQQITMKYQPKFVVFWHMFTSDRLWTCANEHDKRREDCRWCQRHSWIVALAGQP